jgi:TPR repeat protein
LKTSNPIDLARSGDIEGIMARMTGDAESRADRDAYMWLCLALDFGHEDADERIGDLLEASSLRYDDTRYEVAAAHWELATFYLEGRDGVPRDLALAAKHLERAFEYHDLDAINEGTGEEYSADELLERLPEDARVVLERGIEGDDHARIKRAVDAIRRLVEVSAPDVIVESQKRALRELVAKLCPPPTKEQIEHMGTDPLLEELAIAERDAEAMRERLDQLRAERDKRAAERTGGESR